MTNEQINQRIAEACGWQNCVGGSGLVTRYKGTPSETTVRVTLPDYLNDLNAMHKAENVLPAGKWTRYCQYLAEFGQGSVRFVSVHSNAAQRAEAFLRTIGKWEGAK